MRTEIMNVPIDVISKKEALAWVLDALKKNKYQMLFTPNPEFVMTAQKDKEFMDILKKGDLVIADGIGILLASKLNKVKIAERVTGCDLMFTIFDTIKNMDYSVYILGGKPGVCELAKKNMESKFQNLKIIGCHNGFFDEKQEKLIVEEIQTLKPDILIVCTGFPKQEKWIYKYRDVLPVKVAMGLGGSIDIMAGTVKRAPKQWSAIGLEWLYRLISEPSRLGRMSQLPIFVLEVLKSKWIRE